MASSSVRRKYTIVGIDPGTTMGVAIIDLDGNPIAVFSAKNYSLSDAIARILSLGKTLIVASDVTPMPAAVKKISSIFSSAVHELDVSLSTEEKIALTKGGGYDYNNVHERDALAACVSAFRRYKKKFSQVQKKTPPGVDVEEVKALVVKGVSIRAAINRLITANEEKRGVTEVEKLDGKKCGEESEDLLRLRRALKGKDDKIGMLEELTTDLKARLEEKEVEIRCLKFKLDSMRSRRKKELERTGEIRKRDKEIKRLRAEVSATAEKNVELRNIIAGLKGEREVKGGGGKRIKVMNSFSRAAILDTDGKYGINRGDIVFFEDGSGGGASTAELLAKKGVVAVIYGKELSHFAADTFFECNIPAFSNDEIPLLLREGDFAFVNERLLNVKMSEWRREKKRRREEQRVFIS